MELIEGDQYLVNILGFWDVQVYSSEKKWWLNDMDIDKIISMKSILAIFSNDHTTIARALSENLDTETLSEVVRLLLQDGMEVEF